MQYRLMIFMMLFGVSTLAASTFTDVSLTAKVYQREIPTGPDLLKFINTASSRSRPGRGKSHSRRSMASRVCRPKSPPLKTYLPSGGGIGR